MLQFMDAIEDSSKVSELTAETKATVESKMRAAGMLAESESLEDFEKKLGRSVRVALVNRRDLKQTIDNLRK